MLRRLSRAEVQLLIDDYQSGMSVCEVARMHHIHPQTATLWLTKAGISIRHKIGIPRDNLPEALSLREAGWGWKKLGAHYGCSHTAARNAILQTQLVQD